MYRYAAMLFLALLLAGGTGCETLREAFREAMSEDANRSDDPNSEDYKVRYAVGIFEIVRYPRAGELEKRAPYDDLVTTKFAAIAAQ